jgi:hypothetical protein
LSDQHSGSDQQQAAVFDPKWLQELNREDAKRTHDRAAALAQGTGRAAIENAHLALRTAVLINGGAAVSVLAFLGGLTREKLANSNLHEISSALIWFAFGVAVAGLAMAAAYFTNYYSSGNFEAQERTWQHPYLLATPTSRRYVRASRWCQIIAVSLGFISLVLFVIGMFAVKCSFDRVLH